MPFPYGKNAAELTPSTSPSSATLCPVRGARSGSLVSASHNRIVVSSDPDTMRLPSGENATELTQLSCPVRGARSGSPVSASHNRMVLSYDPDTMRLPSGENAADVTSPLCLGSTL